VGRRSEAGKVSVGLASHWQCITDNSGLPTYRLDGPCRADVRRMALLYLLVRQHANQLISMPILMLIGMRLRLESKFSITNKVSDNWNPFWNWFRHLTTLLGCVLYVY